MKKIFTIAILVFTINSFAQSPSNGIPDSVQNVSYPNSTGQYTISNPLIHNGTMFTNAPTTVSCIINCKSDYLYFYDFGLNIPLGATITGIEVIHTRGGCNSGSYVIDSLHLAYNGVIISAAKRDSTSSGTDTLGSSSDNWSAVLTPAIVNSNSFGLFINSTGNGICTFGQFNIQMKVYNSSAYSTENIADKTVELIFPNPVIDYLNLEVSYNNIGSIYNIYDFTGKIIGSGKITAETTRISTTTLKSGLYFIRIFGLIPQTIKFIRY